MIYNNANLVVNIQLLNTCYIYHSVHLIYAVLTHIILFWKVQKWLRYLQFIMPAQSCQWVSTCHQNQPFLEKNRVHANNLASFHKYNSTFILIITKLQTKYRMLTVGFMKPTTHTRENPHSCSRVRVPMGMGAGCPGKPQGSPWNSLLLISNYLQIR
jgi:CDP-diglyceride synthetase